MKLTVLVDNNTLIDKYYLGEPAVSYWIESDGKNLLFDLGYSDIFIKNGKLLNINFKKTDYLVLSHGHLDHTWGMEHFIKLVGPKKTKNIKLIAHPDAFNRKIFEGFGDIGTKKRKEEIEKYFDLRLTKNPFSITQNLYFLGEIPRVNEFEGRRPIGRWVIKRKEKIPDYLLDDSALVYKSKDGLVIITGCSHSGICNIVEYAKKIFKEEKIKDIIGGFHLYNTSQKILEKIVEYFKSCKIKVLHPCHCTGLRGKIALSKYFLVEEVGSGLILTYD